MMFSLRVPSIGRRRTNKCVQVEQKPLKKARAFSRHARPLPMNDSEKKTKTAGYLISRAHNGVIKFERRQAMVGVWVWKKFLKFSIQKERGHSEIVKYR